MTLKSHQHNLSQKTKPYEPIKIVGGWIMKTESAQKTLDNFQFLLGNQKNDLNERKFHFIFKSLRTFVGLQNKNA